VVRTVFVVGDNVFATAPTTAVNIEAFTAWTTSNDRSSRRTGGENTPGQPKYPNDCGTTLVNSRTPKGNSRVSSHVVV
jgi:hypothetical protein